MFRSTSKKANSLPTICLAFRTSPSSVWPDLAKFHHFCKSLQVFGKLLTVYFLFGKMLSILWEICDIIELSITDANDQIWKNNQTIWSHCLVLKLVEWSVKEWKRIIAFLKRIGFELEICTRERKIERTKETLFELPRY